MFFTGKLKKYSCAGRVFPKSILDYTQKSNFKKVLFTIFLYVDIYVAQNRLSWGVCL